MKFFSFALFLTALCSLPALAGGPMYVESGETLEGRNAALHDCGVNFVSATSVGELVSSEDIEKYPGRRTFGLPVYESAGYETGYNRGAKVCGSAIRKFRVDRSQSIVCALSTRHRSTEIIGIGAGSDRRRAAINSIKECVKEFNRFVCFSQEIFCFAK